MGCGTTFLGVEPEQDEYKAVGNADLSVPVYLWEDKAKGIPLNLTGYTPRAALKNINTNAVTNVDSISITMTASETFINAIWYKATIESLPTNTPFIIDVAVDNSSTKDSFDAVLGTVYFIKGASS